jgi:Family of unknown function (DUF6335)
MAKETGKRRKKPAGTLDAGTAERPLFVTDPEVQLDLQEASRHKRSRQKPAQPRRSSLSGGDVDAVTQEEGAGEEAVGGSVATPDQDIVENLGRAAGMTYQDDEELNPVEKVKKRDRKRWELNPSSAEDYLERKQSGRGW